MHRDDVDPAKRTGVHVDAARWNRLLDDPDVTVDRCAQRLRDRTRHVSRRHRSRHALVQRVPALRRNARPSRAQEGCDVLHRRHPLRKSERVPARARFRARLSTRRRHPRVSRNAGADNRFAGECFVFDQRVSVTDDLAQGQYASCHACRAALTQADTESPDYVVDMSCPHCVGTRTERATRGVRRACASGPLAAARGERHVGAVMNSDHRRQR